MQLREAVHGEIEGFGIQRIKSFVDEHHGEVSARPEFAQAAAEFAGDPWGRPYSWSNLGIICQRLGDLHGALLASPFLCLSQRPFRTGQHLMAVQRGLGSVYRAYGEYPRAQHAYREALRLALSVEDRVAALLGEARTLALWGRCDEALSTLYDAAGQAGQLGPEGGDHRVFASVAAIRLMLGDHEGAQAALNRAGGLTRDDGHLVAVVHAELLRTQGHEEDARDLLAARNMRSEWVGETARLFPALFALVDIHPVSPAPWTAEVNAEGPVTVRMHGEALPLRPQRPEAALLVLLLEGGTLRRERVQDALDLPGRDENARRKALSRVVGDLRDALGWPGAVQTGDGLLRLSTDLTWVLHTPGPEQAESFCEGRLDPWLENWRLHHAPLSTVL
ncbi:hypothetical protein SAMN00790413_04819 [Deinococcus hopiensis KR-140]|uniref:Uncharacterized protein n=2 Tax=Deinococcus TaxID=1298 RepID=A0A1W1UM06_9DEIO|nr:hypothetical protein SAMN00790413_04819 [Deinococcus hopiensis KR-140]